ncbi:PAS domain S-box protein [Halodesulfurarchaeum sp.]|uniref:PAS domain S-box protein n=1 Tax=Halodesulfurarchaeum sp. TaxID=1980530 RepID=UPI002FC2B447
MGDPTRSQAQEQAVVAASIDGAGLLEGDVFATVNEELAAVFQYDEPDALVGTPWTELYPQTEQDYLKSQVLPKVSDGQGWRGTVQGRRADGSTFKQVLSIRPTKNGHLAWVVRDLADGSAPEEPNNSSSEPRQGRRPSTDNEDGVAASGRKNVDRFGTGADGDLGFEFRLLAEHAPIPVAVATADRGIVYSNREAVELLGAEHRREVFGKDPEQLVHPDEREQARRRLRRVIENREATEPAKYSLVGVDDEERYGEIATVPVTYQGESGAYIVVNDVTAYRRSQARLQRERRFLETVLDVVDDVIYVLDEDGETYLWNETLAETTGYSHEEINEMHTREFLPEEQYEYVPGLIDAIDSIEDRRVDLDVLTKDGERIPHEFRGTSFENPTTGEVFRCGIARDISERLEYEQRLERYETIVETIDDGVYALDEDLQFSFVNDALCEMLGYSRESLLGTAVRDLVESDEVHPLVEDIRRRVDNGNSNVGTVRGTYDGPDGEFIYETRYRMHPEPDDQFQEIVGVLRDVTEREQRKREIERKLDELGTLDRINRTLLETTRDLIRSGSRNVIEQTVCSQLAGSDLYEFAWTSEQSIGGEQLTPRSAAGGDRGLLDAVGTDADNGEVTFDPAAEAIRTGQTIIPEKSIGGPGDAAIESGFESTAAIPLHHEGTVYGVLVVHTEREDAFSERELEGFDILGRTVGFIINAVRSHRLLFTDAVVDLEFLIPGPDSILGPVAEGLDCELTLTGHVARGSRWVLYVDVDGATPKDAVGALSSDSSVERARVIRASDDEGRIELVVTPGSLLHTINHAGGTLRTAVADRRKTHFTVEAPAEADVRAIVERIQTEYPAADLLAQRERSKEATTPGRPDGVLGNLTDRQRESLETAYRAGYYDWPRRSTATDVAESLGIASSTLHGHLRKAEGIVLSTVFEQENNSRGEAGATTPDGR